MSKNSPNSLRNTVTFLFLMVILIIQRITDLPKQDLHVKTVSASHHTE